MIRLRRERPTACVGVDVDALCHYYRIHGLDDSCATNAAWSVGVPRFVELFSELGIPATFYCVAEDLDEPGNPARLRSLVDAGHEIGNHTWHHPYALTQLPAETRRAEVAEGRARLAEAAGAPVLGFRAPGYLTSAALVADVAASGHTYDSSVFPCGPYYLAKAAAMSWLAARGRPSRSVIGHPAVLRAPRTPYRMSRRDPHLRAGRGEAAGAPLQVPITVSPGGAPLIGTAFTALGRFALPVLDLAIARGGHLTVEFHAADLLGLDEDGLDPVLRVQPDLRVPVARKRRVFRAVLARLARRTRVDRLDRLVAEDRW